MMDQAVIGKGNQRLLGSLRCLKFFVCWLLVWQDSSVNGSIFQLYEYVGRMESVRPIEMFLAAMALIFLIERTILGDWTVKRSYFYGPILLMLLALFISWCRGVYITQNFGVVYEVHEAFAIPFVFFLLLNVFRDERDRRILFYILILGTIPKAVEGAYIKYFSDDENKGWGVLQMWRDGFLLAFGIASILILLHFKDPKLKWLKKWMLWTSPFLVFTLIVSYRRTFFVAILVSALALIVTIGRGRRLKQIGYVLAMLVAFIVFIVFTDPIGFIGRLAGIVQPGEEGSAYIRLMELPNVLMNIRDNPIFGTAIGTHWHEYYRMPTFANYTSVGVHNTYLYWPLRAGILGAVGFLWLLLRMWKAAIICYRLSEDVEDRFIGQLAFHILIIYQVACFFGMMYGDAVTVLLSLVLVSFQLQVRGLTDRTSLRDVSLWETWKSKQIVYKPHYKPIPMASTAPVSA